MMHFPLPLPILVLCIISFCGYLIKHRSRHSSNSRRKPHPIASRNDYSLLRDIRDRLKGYESESFEVVVSDYDQAGLTLRYPLGYPVSFIKKGDMNVVVDGISIDISVPIGSKFENKIFGKTNYKAFITDRSLNTSGYYDIFTVTVYYKLN